MSREDDSMGENIDSDSDEEMSKVRKSKKRAGQLDLLMVSQK